MIISALFWNRGLSLPQYTRTIKPKFLDSYCERTTEAQNLGKSDALCLFYLFKSPLCANSDTTRSDILSL